MHHFETHILRHHFVLERPLQRVRKEDYEVLVQLILPGALHVHHALHIAVLEFGEEPVEDLEILADVLRVLRERAEALLAQQHSHLDINYINFDTVFRIPFHSDRNQNTR